MISSPPSLPNIPRPASPLRPTSRNTSSKLPDEKRRRSWLSNFVLTNVLYFYEFQHNGPSKPPLSSKVEQ